MAAVSRVAPNIMIAGTPGTGKSTLAKELSQRSGLNYINIGEVAEQADCMDGYDEELQCGILDEDKVIDELEETMSAGGNIVDYHSCEFFPQRWFDIVFVLRTDNTILHSRLTERGYNEKKIEGNISSEIFQVILDAAKDSYPEEIVHELPSDNADQLESNLDKILEWLALWKQQH
ncbi:adenylate kinase isoenzyme 6-like [Physella acuta]|uniref:adenylate kinase isoenzyme 6-like n=1 Tax=Physella acuta TaxID=109671 RepID=UPI0027DB1AA0|nr:adenylate kinase isoenzyme 6-like [Physella acuta]